MQWSSVKVRETFINYFLRHPKYRHVFVPSSSVVPRKDPTLAFTNAGMNQFKDIILGNGKPKHPRVANSQKCIRINDLNLVGVDNSHHTFFEMLGNWSFANYFKAEACEMAWVLLTEVYKINPDRLYFTYFAGNENIPPDLETKEIWQKIGIPEWRILPFVKDNFWQMGPFGPCGPSTEIHYDHRGTNYDPAPLNKDGGEIVEIWNLVFMQYNRRQDGRLERLPLSHVVDTGAGLERLTAILNNKMSNYETDLFTPIFDKIHTLTGTEKYGGSMTSHLDTAYRTFADHIRASTVSLSDGILPQKNQKIRRVFAKSLSLTRSFFLPEIDSDKDLCHFIQENVSTVSNILSSTYPEIEKNKSDTLEILNHEIERFLEYQKKKDIYKKQNTTTTSTSTTTVDVDSSIIDFPELARISNEDLKRVKEAGFIDAKTAYFWTDSLGISEEALVEFASHHWLNFDKEDLRAEQESIKNAKRQDIFINEVEDKQKQIIRKIESFLSLYKPTVAGGIFHPGFGEEGNVNKSAEPEIITVEWVFDEDGEPLEEVDYNTQEDGEGYWILLNRTPFFPETEISQSDLGLMYFEKKGGYLHVNRVIQTPSGWLLHHVSSHGLKDSGFSRKSQIRKVHVDNERRLGRTLSHKTFQNLQNWLSKSYGVVRFDNEFIQDDGFSFEVTFLKGVLDLEHICACERDLNDQFGTPLVFTDKISQGNGVYDVECSIGLSAELVLRRSTEVRKKIGPLNVGVKNFDNLSQEKLSKMRVDVEELESALQDEDIKISLEIRQKAENAVESVKSAFEKRDAKRTVDEVIDELELLVSESPFIVKVVKSDLEFTSLKKMTRIAESKSKPVLLAICSSKGYFQARCAVPKGMVQDDFHAEGWLTSFVSKLGHCSVSAPKGQDSKLFAKLKRQKLDETGIKNLEVGIKAAHVYCQSIFTLRGDEKRNL